MLRNVWYAVPERWEMPEYPEADVERMLEDAAARMEQDDNAGWGDAYERISALLLERLVAAWADIPARRALLRLAAAEAQLRRFVRDRPCLLQLNADQTGMFADTLELCVQAIGACQAAQPAWVIAGHGEHADIAMLIAEWAQMWDDRREEARRAAGGRGLLLHTSVLTQVHDGLHICFLLFMTEYESAVFSEQINLAISSISRSALLFAPELGTQLQ